MKKMKKRSECPVSYCLDFLGDKWTLLIIRDMIYNDKETFGDFLKSGEGIATNVLTDRLKMLEEEGFIVKVPVAGKARVGYYLAERGISLIPISIEMALWGASQNVNGYDKEFSNQVISDKNEVIKKLTIKLKRKLELIKV